MANKNINDLPTATSLNAGDKLEILQGGTNKQIDSSLLVSQSTPLGLIQIVDLNGELFTNLTTAKAWIRNFVNDATYPITNESFENKVFYFTVPRNTATTITEFMSNTSASFIDRFGLFIGFNYGSFNFNNGNNYFGKPDIVAYSYGTIFDGNSFESASGINTFSSFDINSPATDEFGKNATGKFIFNENIGQVETANFVNFFITSTATIWANASKYTSNLGGINGNLQTAITNGCNVFFDGIDKEDKRNKSTSIITDLASNIKYPSVKSVFDWVTALFATKGNSQPIYSGKWRTIPYVGIPTTTTGNHGTIFYMPYIVNSTHTVTDIGIEVSTAAIASYVRLALYSDNNGVPGTLIEQSGAIGANTLGLKTYTFTSPIVLLASNQVYWMAVQASAAGIGLRATATVVSNFYILGTGNSGSAYTQTQAFGAFPASATGTIFASSSSYVPVLKAQ